MEKVTDHVSSPPPRILAKPVAKPVAKPIAKPVTKPAAKPPAKWDANALFPKKK